MMDLSTAGPQIKSLSKKIGLQEGKMSLGYARSEENPLVLFLVKKHEVVIKITPENNLEHRNESK